MERLGVLPDAHLGNLNTDGMHELTLERAAYSTMLACDLYYNTPRRHINFAPLSSSPRFDASDPTVMSRRAYLAERFNLEPLLPPPVSPKSVYVCTSRLRLSELWQRSFDEYREQIVPENVLLELESELGRAPGELHSMLCEYAAQNFAELKGTAAFEALAARALNDDDVENNRIGRLLFKLQRKADELAMVA